jgi:hypothetical protein
MHTSDAHIKPRLNWLLHVPVEASHQFEHLIDFCVMPVGTPHQVNLPVAWRTALAAAGLRLLDVLF